MEKKLFAESVLQYYRQLQAPTNLPADVEVMNPYKNAATLEIASQFYRKYYSDYQPRIMLFGINPGRFGAGLTGVPFTDPARLEEVCGIPNDFDKKPELSSRFINEMVLAYGGPESFYAKYFISGVSPLGYLREGINLNYYDIKGFKPMFEDYVVAQIKEQLKFGIDQSVAYSIGKGQNIKYLNYINDKHGFFEKMLPLSHPRWVMQYRLKRKDEFIQEYLDAL
jgi:hypothetical protein